MSAPFACSAAHSQTTSAADDSLRPGQTFQECRYCPEMIVLPPGDFVMGSPPDEPLRRENEPQQEIAISRAFVMSRTPRPETSGKRACATIAATASPCRHEDRIPLGKRARSRPREFRHRRSGIGRQGRGPRPLAQRDVSGRLVPAERVRLVRHARQHFEWTEDCYEADRANAQSDGSANKQGNCANRVFRSGTFLSNPYMQRSARHGAPYPATQRRRNYLGFRAAKTLD